MKYVKTVEDVVSTWSRISVHPHRFGGREVLFGAAEVGHIHTHGIVDIPFTRPVHDVLLAEGLAEQHRLLDWFYLERKRGAEAITDEFDFRMLDREKLLLYAQKYPRPVKHQLLESLARAGAAVPNGKSSTSHEIKS